MSVKKLVIDLEGMEYGDSEFQPLFSTLQTLSNIRHFELNLDATELQDEGLGNIASKLFEKEQLETLILNCRETNISTSKGLRKLSNIFGSLMNLKTFNIELFSTETSSESVMKLLQSLTQCKKLESLFLGLGETKINEQMKSVSSVLQ